jgi:uncharacterized protein YbjT (DUF2867 family)
MDEAEQPRRVVVAGATGYLGRHVVRALHDDGWIVRALVRDEARLGDARAACDEVFVGEATDPATLEGLFDGVDAALSSIGIRHFGRHPTFREVDRDANLHLVELAERAGVKRYVFVSVLRGDESRDLSPLIDARERVVDRLGASPMQTTILRPTGFFNDMAEYFAMAQRGRVWLLGDGQTKVNPIHGADLARVAADALGAATPPATRSVGGPDTYTQREIAALAFAAVGTAVRTSRIPPWLLTTLGYLATPVSANAGALLRMFTILGRRDVVGEATGDHHLPDFFAELGAKAG